MTLSPGQRATGRFVAPRGGTALVVLTRWPPEFAGRDAPVPGAVTWRGDNRVRIHLPDDPASADEPLGFTSFVVGDLRAFRVFVRNADTVPVAFCWTVTGSCDVIADWDLSTAESAR